jgi:hypothetical protein
MPDPSMISQYADHRRIGLPCQLFGIHAALVRGCSIRSGRRDGVSLSLPWGRGTIRILGASVIMVCPYPPHCLCANSWQNVKNWQPHCGHTAFRSISSTTRTHLGQNKNPVSVSIVASCLTRRRGRLLSAPSLFLPWDVFMCMYPMLVFHAPFSCGMNWGLPVCSGPCSDRSSGWTSQ